MSPEEIQKTIERYNKRLEEYGISEKTLGWGDKGRSKLRFEILCSEWDFENKTVLDFGCGFGDLYQYIKDTRNIHFNYIGIDLNSKLIDIAKKRNYENADFHVVTADPTIFLDSLDHKIDYILSSGIFNFKIEDNISYIKNTLDIFNRYAECGFASNFLSNKVNFKTEINYHSDPSEILNLHYKYGNNLILKNNYMPFEFTVFMNKNDKINNLFNIYESFLKFI